MGPGYTYHTRGRPTQITYQLGGTTQFQWSADNAVTQLTEPNGATRKFDYNDNGDPLDVIDELGDHTVLTYQNVAADASDASIDKRSGRPALPCALGVHGGGAARPGSGRIGDRQA